MSKRSGNSRKFRPSSQFTKNAQRLRYRPSLERLECRQLLAADTNAGADRGFLTDEILVQYVPNAPVAAHSQAHVAVGGGMLERIRTSVMERFGAGDIERVSLGAGMTVERAIEALGKNPWVASAGPNFIYQPSLVSNDTYYTNGNLWGMYGDDSPSAVGPSGTTNQYGIQAEKAWNANITGSASIVVGIIDEGIQYTHPDLVSNIWTNPWDPVDGIDNDGNGYVDDTHGWDFFYNDNSIYDTGEDSHGTHVAGTIGGQGGNGLGVAGVNWDVTMISAKFLGPGGGSTANAIKAVDYLTDLKIRHGINLVASNNSWGGGGYSQALHDAIIRGAKADILFVAAAGNATANNDSAGYYPSNYNTSVGTSTTTAASYDGVIAVASITSTGAISSFSSYGATTVDIGAPGSSIYSSLPTDTYGSYSGTSMATPHVTGAIALYASVQPFAPSGAMLKAAILDSATPTTSLIGKTLTGGRLNVYAALQQAAYLDLDADSYTLPDVIGLSVQHPDANLNAGSIETVVVQISSTTETTPVNVTMVETGTNTGVFAGSIQVAAGTANASDNILQAAHGNTITAAYTPLGQTATATVDAVAPTISSITSTPRPSSADVKWTTNEAATTEVIYGTSSTNLSNTYNDGVRVTSHTAVLGGLTPLTTYYYQVRSRDAAGNVTTSATGSFTTTAPAPILFVDDDQGAAGDVYFTNALQANSYSFDTWNVASVGATPTGAQLAAYGMVIWNTGYDFSSAGAGLSASEQTAIQAYLDGGGKIFISGQDVLYNGVTTTFRQSYLKVASYVSDVATGSHTETGVTGNAVSNGQSLSVAPVSAVPTLYVDALSPASGAEGTYLHGVTSASYPYSTVNYRGNYATGGFGMVFSTVPFEAISSSASNPNNQTTVMKRVVDYLNGAPLSGITVSAPSGTSTTEAGGTVTFTVRLDSQPSANVTIPVSSSDTTEGSVSASSLVFTNSNWNTAQTVTVTGVNDEVDDGNIAYSIVIGAASSTDASYNGVNPADIGLTNIDNDTAGITVSAPSGTSTTEAGGTVTFTVKLDSQPTASVTIPISSNDTTEGVVSTGSLVFTTSNWNSPQTVTVTGVDDTIVDGDVAYKAVIGVVSSTDALYNGLNPADINLTNLDNDVAVAGVSVSEASGSTTSEVGGSVSFTVVLDKQPTADVRIPISSNDLTEATVSPSEIIFTAENWSTSQSVMVTGANDSMQDGPIGYKVIIGTPISSDGSYSSLASKEINLTNLDNDTIVSGITVSAPSGATTTEVGGSVTFTVKLSRQPTANVTIPINSNDTSEGTVNKSSLTFTKNNWGTAQVVTVTGVDDSEEDGNMPYVVVLGAVSSSDATFRNLDPPDVELTNSDNDKLVPGITVSAPSGPSTTEAGGTVTFTVKLDSPPTASVTIQISSSDPTEGTVSTSDTVSPSELVFTNSNWNTTQLVTVTGVDDAVDDGNIAYSILIVASSTDASYNGVNPPDINLTNLDNDNVVSTKFYVVDDGANRTHEYDPSGTAVENYALDIGNTTPRGIASTVKGDYTWVVDKNRNVYVYTPSGDLHGSWTAGTLASTATVEGITTDGTNIWIVDSKSDKIFYYAGAASRTSGSQAATASYSLGSGNTNPKDLVYGMDNSNNGFLWVVNDATTDKIFRYSVTVTPTSSPISLLNSWNLNTTNSLPTGITLDPGSTSGDLWVLDNGTTKRVFVYSGGRGVVGSTTPTSSPAFTVSGSSPQGIADPPPAGYYVPDASTNDTATLQSGAFGNGFAPETFIVGSFADAAPRPFSDLREPSRLDSEVTDQIMETWDPTPAGVQIGASLSITPVSNWSLNLVARSEHVDEIQSPACVDLLFENPLDLLLEDHTNEN